MTRHELVKRSAAQRAAIIAAAQPLLRAAAAPDRISGYVRRYPAGIAIAAAAIAVLGPRKLLAAGARLLTLYTLFRQLAR
ncbi:MAG: hypothetical protein K0S03_2184 [Burkholderiales bacterium]|jgi:hypothetical protein|nr:hypothetical protein [Burkholderiales bacterium]